MNFFFIPCFITIFFLSREYDLTRSDHVDSFFTNPFATDENQARGFAILLILCIVCLTLDIMVVGMRCDEIFMTGDDCAVGIGYFGIAAMCIVMGLFSVWGLHRAWRLGHLQNFKFF